MNVAVIGLGLIGGSMAKAVKSRTDHRVYGHDLDADVVAQALSGGAIDEATTEDFSGVDLLLLALYPKDTVAFLERHKGSLRPGSTVVDLCGVKRYVCGALGELFRGTDITFIGGHPMAGKECSGYTCSTGHLFQGASMILTPEADTPSGKLEQVSDFFRSVGFGHIQLATPEQHDEVIAFTSQLAHVLSSAYVQCPSARQHMGFSAGSFQDLTRVAKLNEKMWTELFLLNADYLADQIDELVVSLQTMQRVIRGGNAEALEEILRQGREIKEALMQGRTPS